MFSALLAIMTLPYLDISRTRGIQFKPANKIAFFALGANFILLMILGAKHVESPFIEIGMLSTLIYFMYFLLNIPSISFVENILLVIIPSENKEKLSSNFHSYQYLPQQSNFFFTKIIKCFK